MFTVHNVEQLSCKDRFSCNSVKECLPYSSPAVFLHAVSSIHCILIQVHCVQRYREARNIRIKVYLHLNILFQSDQDLERIPVKNSK